MRCRTLDANSIQSLPAGVVDGLTAIFELCVVWCIGHHSACRARTLTQNGITDISPNTFALPSALQYL